jgi:hypothetical protein
MRILAGLRVYLLSNSGKKPQQPRLLGWFVALALFSVSARLVVRVSLKGADLIAGWVFTASLMNR